MAKFGPKGGAKAVPKMVGGGKLPAPANPKSQKGNAKRARALESKYGDVPLK